MRGLRLIGMCRHLMLLIAAWMIAMPAYSADKVLMVGDMSRPYVKGFDTALRSSLMGAGLSLEEFDTENASTITTNLDGYRCIVTVGNSAARKVASIETSSPVLHALVTDDLANELYSHRAPSSQRTLLLVEQPVSRLMLLVHAAVPKKTRVGVLYGPTSIKEQDDVRKQANRIGLVLIEREVNADTKLSDALSYFAGRVDLLITLPDSHVVNEGTVKTLILGAYVDNLPLVGYSQALVKAGAMMAVYSTPEEFGRQSGELIIDSFWKQSSQNGARIYPRYFKVSVNYQVARALDVNLPDEKELEARIRKMEQAR